MPPLCAVCPLVQRRRRASKRRWVVIVPGSRFGDNLAAMCRLIRRQRVRANPLPCPPRGAPIVEEAVHINPPLHDGRRDWPLVGLV